LKRKYTIKAGTQRSWDREVGYGEAPSWYLHPHDIELEGCEPADISKLLEEYERAKDR